MKRYSLSHVLRSGAWGVLLGGTAGVALGMLLAPEEGKKMRRRVIFQLEHLAERTAGLVQRMRATDLRNEARQQGDALVADAEAEAQRIRDDIDALLGEVRRMQPPR